MSQSHRSARGEVTAHGYPEPTSARSCKGDRRFRRGCCKGTVAFTGPRGTSEHHCSNQGQALGATCVRGSSRVRARFAGRCECLRAVSSSRPCRDGGGSCRTRRAGSRAPPRGTPSCTAADDARFVVTASLDQARAEGVARSYGKRLAGSMPLGYADLAALTTFPDNCPNNAPPIFWSAAHGWKPLFPRTAR